MVTYFVAKCKCIKPTTFGAIPMNQHHKRNLTMKRTLVVIVALIGATLATGGSGTAAQASGLTINKAGTYHVKDASGKLETVVVTDSGPQRMSGAMPVAGGAVATATSSAASYWCRFVTYDRDVDLETYDYLQSGLCWNGYQASAYSVWGSCQTGALPGGVCFGTRWGVQCNWCGSVMAWGNYYQNYAWFLCDNFGLAISGNKWGSYWINAWYSRC
jgi:hypothetical protein